MSSTFSFLNNSKFDEGIQNEGHRPTREPDKVYPECCVSSTAQRVLLHGHSESASRLWRLQSYREFIQVLTKVNNITLLPFSRHFLLILIQANMSKDLVLDFVFKTKWMYPEFTGFTF